MYKTGFTSGCFDLLHPLYIQYLTKCKRKCKELVVLLDSDDFVFTRKGIYPTINEVDRKYMLESLKVVDRVSIIDSLEDYYYEISHRTELDVIVVFKHSNVIDGNPLIEIPNADTIIIPDVERLNSTTQLKTHISQTFKLVK